MNFIKINPGKFLMGSPESEKGRFSDERQHEVEITNAFELMDTLVTQAGWMNVMGSNPSRFVGDNNPVECVSWNDAQEFIGKLNRVSGETLYRLPTEAEWECACRAGTTTAFSCPESKLKEHAWFYENSKRKTHPVKQKKPNDWGFYDMHGNVWEWCQDWYAPYSKDAMTNPQGPPIGSLRVLRGGSWIYDPVDLRSALRGRDGPGDRLSSIGFRLARTLPSPSDTLTLGGDPAAKRAEIDTRLARMQADLDWLKGNVK